MWVAKLGNSGISGCGTCWWKAKSAKVRTLAVGIPRETAGDRQAAESSRRRFRPALWKFITAMRPFIGRLRSTELPHRSDVGKRTDRYLCLFPDEQFKQFVKGGCWRTSKVDGKIVAIDRQAWRRDAMNHFLKLPGFI